MNVKSAPMVVDKSPLSWLTVVSSSTAAFSAQARALLGQDVADSLAAVLPYSIIVTNTSQTPITGSDVRFTLTAGGRVISKNFFYNSFSPTTNPVLPPGQSRLFTPLRGANAMAAASLTKGVTAPSGGWPRSISSADSSTMRDLGAAQLVKVSVDFVVASDGRTAGADRAGTLKKLTQTLIAYRELREQCLDHLVRGDADATIQEWLRTISSKLLMVDPETGSGDRYTSMQKQLAGQWLTFLTTGRRDQLYTSLSAATPETQLGYIANLRGGLQ